MSPTLKLAAWTHGAGIQLQSPSWSAFRQGFYTTVRPVVGETSAWVHFTIPTPVVVDDVRLKAAKAGIRVATGSKAHIGSFHVYDGEKIILEQDGVNITGALQFAQYVLPDAPEVLWGTGISLLVVCADTSPDAWVELVSAGIDFH